MTNNKRTRGRRPANSRKRKTKYLRGKKSLRNRRKRTKMKRKINAFAVRIFQTLIGSNVPTKTSVEALVGTMYNAPELQPSLKTSIS